jgi:Alr-MurF fusion protein
MHRLGFEEKDIDALIHQLNINPAIKVASIFSHLAAADDILQNDFSLKQIELFNTIAAQIQEQVNYPIYKHILNSPGISKFTSGQFDMVRLGIGLYGIDPADVIQKKLLPVSSLHTTISQIKNIQAGDSIGYGRSQIAVKNMRIATINIGYADGFSRRMSNGNGKVYVHGKLAPVVGKVCMDMTMIDISDIEQVKEGDEVELFGLNISINTYADWQQTIPYEIMTGISQRVKRIYLQE